MSAFSKPVSHARGSTFSPGATPELEARTIRKVTARLIPFLIVCYFVAYLDRVNVGFAALTMNQDLGLTASMYGFGAGVFFLAYFGLSNAMTGLVTAIPYVVGTAGMIWFGRHSDRSLNRRRHLVVALLIAACGVVGPGHGAHPRPRQPAGTSAGAGRGGRNLRCRGF